MTIQRVKAAAVLLALSLWCDGTAWAERRLGAQGVEGAPHRRHEWLVPAPDPAMPSRALLFRPPGKGPFRIAVIAHASTQNRLARAQMPQPDYPGLTAALVARGFAVLVPQRLGHGQTGLSTAFDMPTLMGYDSDHERARGEVGREGVSVSSLQDMEVLFDGIDLDAVTTSMTVNCTASIIFAMP